MIREEIVGLGKLEGVVVKTGIFEPIQGAFVQSVQAVLGLLDVSARGIPGGHLLPMSMIESAALLSINTMLSASSAQCTLAAPAEAINMTNNSTGRLVYRCAHSPPHEWDLGGTRRA